MNAQLTQEHKLVLENKYAKVVYYPEVNTLVCTALKGYIPIAEFRDLFNQLRDFIKREYVKKFIFDKRQMTVFDQPSMVWYHLEWKNEMLKYGLRTYRKLLPKDKIFRFSVEVGRKKIINDHPEFSFDNFDIKYLESLEDAFAY